MKSPLTLVTPALKFPSSPRTSTTIPSTTLTTITAYPSITYQELFSFSSAFANGSPLNAKTLPSLLKACAFLGLRVTGVALHQQTIVHGHAADPHVSSSLLHMYSCFRDAETARLLFDAMPVKNVVPWSAIIACYARAVSVNTAFSLLNEMVGDGVIPNSVTIIGLLSGVDELDALQCLHGWAVQYGFESDIVLANSLLNVYAKLRRLELAHRLFDLMVWRDIVSWNSMIAGYALIGDVWETVDLLRRMTLQKVFPDHQTFGSLVSSITNCNEGVAAYGTSAHALIVTCGYESDTHLNTSLISMYFRFGLLEHAFVLFDRALYKDRVMWTAIVSGLVQNGLSSKAVSVFHDMLLSGVIPNTSTVTSVLSACANLCAFHAGASIHGYILRQYIPLDTATENSLISMYAKCGYLRQSRVVFDTMKRRDLVSWNAVISGYARNKHLAESFLLSQRMISSQKPDSITMIALLQGCASLGALDHGRSVHAFIVRQYPKPAISVDTSLVDMYAKCGDLETARRLFTLMPLKDLVTWSVIIEGYGNHGMGDAALCIYHDFLDTGMQPNDVMFLSVLSACNHAGFIPKGIQIFRYMEEEFAIKPRLEHSACVIDMLCRGGRVEEAFSFIQIMSQKPTAEILGIILDACRVRGFAKLAEEIADEIRAMTPESAGSYVQLVNNFAVMNKWEDVGQTWSKMRAIGLRKTPGWSSIELNMSVTTFFADHSSHPQNHEIIQVLEILELNMRKDCHLVPCLEWELYQQ